MTTPAAIKLSQKMLGKLTIISLRLKKMTVRATFEIKTTSSCILLAS